MFIIVTIKASTIVLWVSMMWPFFSGIGSRFRWSEMATVSSTVDSHAEYSVWHSISSIGRYPLNTVSFPPTFDCNSCRSIPLNP